MDTSSMETLSAFSSSVSTPAPPMPFTPKYTVRFTSQVTKDGEIVMYTIKIIRTDGTFEEHTIQRQYEDLEWLDHCLSTSRNINGIIVPPIPPKPVVSKFSAEAKSKKVLGNCSRTLIGDEFQKDCHAMEMYLNILLCHSQFGQDPHLETFLTKHEAPVRTKIKKGLLTRLSEKIDSRKYSHKDCEEFFQKERDWADTYGDLLKEACKNFNKMVCSQQRLCSALDHLSIPLTLNVGSNDSYNGILHRLMLKFSEGLNDIKPYLHQNYCNDESILGSLLEMYSRYIDAEKEMLLRRTCLLVDYEHANKGLNQAKGVNCETAEKAKLEAEKAFEECSDVARQEIKKFHRYRVKIFHATFQKYAETQLRNACELYAIIGNSLHNLEHFPLPKTSTLSIKKENI